MQYAGTNIVTLYSRKEPSTFADQYSDINSIQFARKALQTRPFA